MTIESIQLFGLLVLAFLGIIAPFFIFILSFSREGRKILISQYAEDIKNYEKKIEEIEDKKSKGIGDIENKVKEINIRLKELNKYKKVSEKKVSSLNIKNQALYLFIPLIASFILVIISLMFSYNLLCITILMIFAVIIFFFSLFKLWKLLCIIIEIRSLIDDRLVNYRNKTLNILEKLIEDKNTSLPEFELLSAIYGTEKKFIDVTEKLKLKIKENKLTVTANNEIDGDPHIGQKKKLIIDYISYSKVYRVEIPENEKRTIPDDFQIKD